MGDLLGVIDADPEWGCVDKQVAVRSAGRMDRPEPLIAAYELRTWYNPTYVVPKNGVPDLDKMCSPLLNPSYRGISRITPSTPSTVPVSSLTLPPGVDIEFAEEPTTNPFG